MKTNKNLNINITGSIFTTLFTALFLMLNAPSIAQVANERENVNNPEVDRFERSDINKDRQLDQEEFGTAVIDSGLYGDWDTNYDGVYDDDELYTGFFNKWDTDQDGVIDRNEYATGNTEWELEYGDNFQEWDANEDDQLDMEEYSNAMNQTGVTATWDANSDGLYSDDEINEGIFNARDADDDGFVSEDEYNETGFGSDLRE